MDVVRSFLQVLQVRPEERNDPHPCRVPVNVHEQISKFLQIAVLRILRVDPTPWVQPSSNRSTLDLNGACRRNDRQWEGQFPLTMVLGVTRRYVVELNAMRRHLLANLKGNDG